MGKSRTRLVVSSSGIDKEILSIAERSNGDLVLVVKEARNHGVVGDALQVREKRYSVHRSQRSAGFTIKQTYDLSDGSRRDAAQFRTPGPDGLVAFAYTKTVQRLDEERYDLRARRSDRIIKLYEEDIADHLLFYSLIVTEPGANQGAPTKFKKTVIGFQYFDLVLLSGFFPVSPQPGSDEMAHWTSVPRLGRIDTPLAPPSSYLEIDSRSSSFVECCQLSKAFVAGISASTANRFIARPDASPDVVAFIDDVRNHVVRFRACPTAPLEIM